MSLPEQKEPVKYRKLSYSERNDYDYILAKEDRIKSIAVLGAESYDFLVQSSTVLADKSRFIYDMLENEMPRSTTLLFALPYGSGKTTLLTMLRDFVKEKGPLEGRIFDQQFEKGKQIAIMREKYEQFCSLHYGMYPTLFIDLDMDAKNASEVEKQINQLISGLFDNEFNHLEDWLGTKVEEKANRSNKQKLKMFQEFADEKNMTRETWNKALDFLIKNIVEYSKEFGRSKGTKRPIIIVDNCDGPIVNFKFNSASSKASRKELEKIIGIVQTFMKCLSKANEKKRFMIASGNYQFGMETLESHKITMERDLLVAASLQPDIMANFGFNECEFLELCNAYRFDSVNIDEARAYFNGFVLGNTPAYFTWSTMAMLNNNTEGLDLFKIHCIESPFFQHFHTLFKREAIAEKVEQIFRGNASIDAKNNQNFTSVELLKLHSYVDSDENSPTQPVDLFVRFLIATGYVTRQGNLLVIPNEEKMTIMKNLMTQHYYDHKYKFAITYSNMITDELARIAMGDVKDGEELKQALLDMLAQMTMEDKNEAFLQTIVGFAALRVRYWTKIALDKVMGGRGANRLARPDVAFSSRTKKFAICAELKWDRTETVRSAYCQMLDREYLTKCKSLISGPIDVAIALAIVGKPPAGKGAEHIDICIEKFVNEEPKQNSLDFLTTVAEKLAEKYSKKT